MIVVAVLVVDVVIAIVIAILLIFNLKFWVFALKDKQNQSPSEFSRGKERQAKISLSRTRFGTSIQEIRASHKHRRVAT